MTLATIEIGRGKEREKGRKREKRETEREKEIERDWEGKTETAREFGSS